LKENKINILGVRVDTTSIPAVLDHIRQCIQENGKGYITVTGVHGIMESQRSAAVKRAHNGSFLTVPDGMPLVYIGRMHGHARMRRCYGPDLMTAIMQESVKRIYTHFLYGGKKGVAENLKKELEQKYPGIRITGTFTPPFRPLNSHENRDLKDLVRYLKPDIVWVGLSTPKQERFMYEYLPLLDTKLMIGVGAAFDIHTNQIHSAPRWMQRLALEWLYRLIQEPKRLWRRYLLNNPLFIMNYGLQKLKLKKYD